jgi:glyoxylase I family protein
MPLGSNKVIPGGGMHHIAVRARNWEESLHFYRDVLGMPIMHEFGPPDQKIVLLDMGDGGYIELFQPKPDTAAPGSPAPNDPVFHFALATTDSRAAIEHVRQAGYKIQLEATDMEFPTMHVTVSFCVGPNGEVVEFFEVRKYL